MPKKRRGFPPGVAVAATCAAMAPAKVGRMASRNGSVRAMPAPRRNVRRERADFVETNGARFMLFILFLFVRAGAYGCHHGQVENFESTRRKKEKHSAARM